MLSTTRVDADVRPDFIIPGSARIEYDGAPVELNQRKAIALLAYLAVTGQSHRRDKLAALLWPHHDQSRARANLRYTLWLLKQALPGDWLWVEPESFSLNPQPEIKIDVSQFEKLLAACPAHTAAPDQLCPVCHPRRVEAVTLYRDDFLAGFSLTGSPEYDEWQFFQTEHLRRKLAAALEKLARYDQEPEQWETALAYARRWLSLDPLHEPAHRQLMWLYAQSGQQAAALRQYQLCVETLQAELGVPPAPETTTLYNHIRTPAPPTPPPPPPPPAPPPPPPPKKKTPPRGGM